MRPIKSDSFPGPINEWRAFTTAGGGTALSTTLAQVGIPNGATHVGLIARNFATGVVMQFMPDPYLLLLKTTDQLATQGNLTDYSKTGQQNPATAGAIVLSSLDVLANNNALYIGSHVPFRGVAVTMSANVNAVVSVLTVKYWNGAWTAVSGFSDGTASGGATFAQSAPASAGVVWTVPTDWVTKQLNQTLASVGPVLLYADKPRYWTQWTVSVQLGANVKANTMFALNRSTAYAEAQQDSLSQFRVFKGPDGIAAIEAQMNAGTGNLIGNAATDNPLGIF